VKHHGSHSQERVNQIEEIRRNPRIGKKYESHPTIFHDLLSSTLPESEKSTDRLAEEAVLLVGAGKNTTPGTYLSSPRPQR
jgi:hypothetical protein